MTPLLAVHNLSLRYGRSEVLRQLSFSLAPGEALGIAGESGSGKSQLALALMGLLPATAELSGAMHYRDTPLIGLPQHRWQTLRGGQMGMVFQDPMTALNPYRSIGAQLVEGAIQHRGISHAAATAEALRLLSAVRVSSPQARLAQYPHECSGGIRQRILIAMALLPQPKLLIADEPTTALDVTVQASLLEVLAELRRELGLALIFISHDLPLLAQITERLLVLYGGQCMETGPTAQLLRRPQHPYTRALLASRPRLGDWGRPLPVIPGQPLASGPRPPGCPFAARCPQVLAACSEQSPPRRENNPHYWFCHCD